MAGGAGTATAGNASIISDGAAAVVVMSEDKAKALGCTVLAEIGSQASYGIDMKYVLVAPIWAVPKCLAKEGITQDQLDMVDSGDLADANKDRKQLKKDVAEQPAQVQQFAGEQAQQVR